jgi:hypothetical protein
MSQSNRILLQEGHAEPLALFLGKAFQVFPRACRPWWMAQPAG